MISRTDNRRAAILPPGGVVRRLLREPMVHFIGLAALIFAAYALLSPPAPPAQERIIVTAEDGQRLAAQYQSTWNRAPTAEEFRNLVDQFVREEVYYREARAYGLDQNDQVVRVRMRQKMEFLLADPAAVAAPAEAELQALFAATASKYAPPDTIAFDQVFLGDGGDGDDGGARAEAALQALTAGADPATLGQPSLLPAALPPARPAQVDASFGAGFFARIAGLPEGQWAGPVRSAYGLHLVRLSAITTSPPPKFEDVRAAVEDDWRRDALRKAAEAAYQAIKARYDVDLSALDPSP